MSGTETGGAAPSWAEGASCNAEEPKRCDLRPPFMAIDGRIPPEFFSLPTPCYVIDEAVLARNGRILGDLAERTGCRVLLAQKAFSNFNLYPALAPYLAGTEASGLYEARLGAEEMPGKEVHVFCAAYREDEMEEILRYADHIVFNSPSQLAKYGPAAKAAGKSVGLRINPECSTQEGHAIYDPCAPGSRLGTTREQWDAALAEHKEISSLLDGLHFHTLCEQDSDALETTLHAVADRFGDLLRQMKWVNFGGGHHITRPGYDLPRLERCIRRAQREWGVTVYLEPGEACALNAGFLLARVLDVVKNGDVTTAILDASAACHMPDVIEMPYRPPVMFAKEEDPSAPTETDGAVKGDDAADTGAPGRDGFLRGTSACTIRLAGPTCLAGDVIGDYRFRALPSVGDLLVFGDMAIYTTCKNNTFNGMALPSIHVRLADGSCRELVRFGYEDFKGRLGR